MGQRIDKDTGLLFPETDTDLALLQSVRDRLMVRQGIRPGRPNYGSILPGTAPADPGLAQNIRDALESDELIDNLVFQFVADHLNITVNYRLQVSV